MNIVCLDLEGVLIPEIWIAFAETTGIEALKRTTRDEPCYDTLMRYRLEILDKEGFKLSDIEAVIGTLDPLPGGRRICEMGFFANTFSYSFRYLQSICWTTYG